MRGELQRLARSWTRALTATMVLCTAMVSTARSEQPLPNSVPGLIVKLKPTDGSGRESAQRAREQLSRVFIGKSLSLGSVRRTGRAAHALRWARDLTRQEAEQLIDSLRRDPRVEWVAPNIREHLLQAVPNDPLFASNQWWLGASSDAQASRGVPNIADAWADETGLTRTVSVAVLDTGLLAGHPDLSGSRFESGYDMVTDEDGLSGDGDGRDTDFSDPGDAVQTNECPLGNDEQDSSWHGSRIAGIIGASTNNALGVAGTNRGARVLSVRVAGKCGALVSDIIDGMRWAAGLDVDGAPTNQNPARVVNISFGSRNTDCTPYQDAIDELAEEGVLVVAAAGNDASTLVNRPARCRGVFAVGAVARDGAKASYSNIGSEIDLMTVGGEITGTPDGGIFSTSNAGESSPAGHAYEGESGTSFSTPIVSGVASLMLTVNPALTRDQLIDGLLSTARRHVSSGTRTLPSCSQTSGNGPCYCTTAVCGAGLLDAPAALAYAAAPDSPPPDDDDDDGGGGGGGSLTGGWLFALALAVGLIARAPRSHAARRDRR